MYYGYEVRSNYSELTTDFDTASCGRRIAGIGFGGS